MIISKKTLHLSMHRGKANTKPVMTCVSNQIIFNKLAASLLNAPVKISFELKDQNLFAFKDEAEGFDVSPKKGNLGVYAISSRPLKRFFESFFQKEKVQFTIAKGLKPDIFIFKIEK